MTDVTRTHAIITGRVQGVWYRAKAQEEAERLGVSGWVRNLSDGSVEAVFEGEPQAVASAIEWCREGPPHSIVENVSTREEVAEGIRGFRIVG